MSPSDRSVTIVGAGVVGLATALTLLRDGRRVTIVDPGGPGEATSYGNAGILAIASVVPLGMPGTLARVPRMLTDPLGPLALPPAYAAGMLPWLARFLAASRPGRVREISAALAAITLPAVDTWRPLLDAADATDLVRRQGCLYLYETEAMFRAAAPDIELRRAAGVAFDVIGPDDIRQLQPALGPHCARALFVPGQGHVVNPLALSQRLAEAVRGAGGTFRRERVQGFVFGPAGPRQLATDAGLIDVEDVVVAAGVHSRPLARQLGHAVPLESERGYHMMYRDPGVDVRLPMLVANGSYAVTPMAEGLRVAGTAEFGGTERPADWRRAEVLAKHARRLFPGLDESRGERWMGHRPSTPDSLPVIGRSPHHPNVFMAFGHGHLGLTQAATTARLVADLVARRTPFADPRPYRPDRF